MAAPRRVLLVAGIAAILGAGLAPHARDAWERRRAAAEAEQRHRWVALKEREIACLERLAASGLPRGTDVEAEIGRCRSLAIDPATGRPVEAPN